MAVDSSEPIRMTLADLVALVLGVAIAAALPADFKLGLNAPILGRACLALVPVMLARRVRYGGFARPAEFLVSACGLRSLVYGINLLLFTRSVGFNPWIETARSFPADEWDRWTDETFRPWKLGMLALGTLSLVAPVLGWKSWPGWLRTVVVLLAWVGLREAWIMVSRWIFSIQSPEEDAFHIVMFSAVFLAIVVLPMQLFVAVPAAAAWLRLRRVGASRTTWLEWASMGLVVADLVAIYLPHALNLVRMMKLVRSPWVHLQLWGFLPLFLVSGVLAFLFVRRIIPGWIGREASGEESLTSARPGISL